MTSLKARAPILMLATGLLSFTACHLQPGPAAHTFALYAPPLTNAPGSEKAPILLLKKPEIDPRFDFPRFTYRINRFREGEHYDYSIRYGFATSPARALATPLRAYLLASGLFSEVTEHDTSRKPTLALKVRVTRLYADHRYPDDLAAVLSLTMKLSRLESEGETKILLRKHYTQRVPISSESPGALVKGWDRALAMIMTKASSDLSAVLKTASFGNLD